MNLSITKRNQFIDYLNRFFESKYFNYIVFLGGFLNWLFHGYIIFSIILIIFSFYIIWNDLERHSFFPILLVYIIGFIPPKTNEEILKYFGSGITIYLMILADGFKNKTLSLKHPYSIALVLIQLVALLSIVPALILEKKTAIHVIADVGRMILWIIPVCYIPDAIKDKQKGRTLLSYSFMCLMFCISLQIIAYILKQENIYNAILEGKGINLEWAVSTHVALVYEFIFPFIIYLYYNSNKIRYLLIAFISLVFPIILRCRGAIYSGIIVVAITLFFLFYRGTKKMRIDVIISILIPSAIFVTIGCITGLLQDIMRQLFVANIDDSNRFDLYELAWKNFLKSPILGTGSYTSQYYNHEVLNTWVNHYHNVFLQALSCTGLVGLGVFIYYLFTFIKLTFKNDTFHQLMFILVIYLIIHGLIDTTFYNYIIMMFLSLIGPLLEYKTKSN